MKPKLKTTTQTALVGTALVGVVLTGCDRRLFDVDLTIVEAVAVADNAADVEISHSTIGNVGEPNGASDERPFTFDDQATEVRFEVSYIDRTEISLVAFGATGPFAVPDLGGVIEAAVLVVPANEVGQLSTQPVALGGDACVADDGLGHVFATGGSASTQGAYVLDDRFSVLGLQNGFPTGVGGAGCAANAGVLAVTGGCGANAEATVALIEVDGGRRTVAVDATVLCGSAAAPRSDGQLWFVDGDNSVDLVSSSGVVTDATVGPRAGVRRGLEVTARDAVVFILDGELEYADTDLVTLGPATALGRRGTDVLVLDADGGVSSVENATTRPLSEVALIEDIDIAHFVVTDDGTFVGLSVDGTTLHVVDSVDAGGGARTLSTTVTGATRVALLPGGAIVIGGADVDGLQAVALPR